MISSKTSNDLFNKIRSKFSNVQLGNALGEVTADTSEAVFFDFEFSEDSDNFGRVSISIADGGTGQITSTAAMTALSSAAFQASSVNVDWGTQVVPPSPIPDANANFVALNALISALSAIGVIV